MVGKTSDLPPSLLVPDIIGPIVDITFANLAFQLGEFCVCVRLVTMLSFKGRNFMPVSPKSWVHRLGKVCILTLRTFLRRSCFLNCVYITHSTVLCCRVKGQVELFSSSSIRPYLSISYILSP